MSDKKGEKIGMINKLALFEEKEIRKTWYNDDWYFSIADIVEILSETANVREYVKKLRTRDKELNSNWGTICTPLKLPTKDGKSREILCSDTKGILRIIQSITSPRAEPFKQWLAQVGAERIDEINDPELAVKRARDTYELKGYSKSWIDNRLLGIRNRNKLTDEWQERGAKRNDYAVLTNQIYKYGFGFTAKQIRAQIGLMPKQNVRDHFSDIDLALTNLGEVTAREIHIKNDSQGIEELKEDTKDAGNIMKSARSQIENKLSSTRKISNK